MKIICVCTAERDRQKEKKETRDSDLKVLALGSDLGGPRLRRAEARLLRLQLPRQPAQLRQLAPAFRSGCNQPVESWEVAAASPHRVQQLLVAPQCGVLVCAEQCASCRKRSNAGPHRATTALVLATNLQACLHRQGEANEPHTLSPLLTLSVARSCKHAEFGRFEVHGTAERLQLGCAFSTLFFKLVHARIPLFHSGMRVFQPLRDSGGLRVRPVNFSPQHNNIELQPFLVHLSSANTRDGRERSNTSRVLQPPYRSISACAPAN